MRLSGVRKNRTTMRQILQKKSPGDVLPRLNPFTPRREISRKGRGKDSDYFGTCKPSGSLSAACRLQSYSSWIAISTSLFIFTPSLRSQFARRMVSGPTDSVMLRRGDCDGLRPAPARLPPWVVFSVFIIQYCCSIAWKILYITCGTIALPYAFMASFLHLWKPMGVPSIIWESPSSLV